MKEFKKPDLNAPRFRPKHLNILNKDFYNNFIIKNPKFKDYTYEDIKNIVHTLNKKLYETAIEDRNGVELFEQLGNIFIGSCPRKVGDNINYAESIKQGVKIQSQNWETDQHVAKIFYTNYAGRYKFRFHQLWSFSGTRDFTRTVSSEYPKQWTKYIVIDKMQKVSKLFKAFKAKDYAIKKTAENLETYNEFDFD